MLINVGVAFASVAVFLKMFTVDGRMLSMSSTLHMSLESSMFVRFVVHHSVCAVGLMKGVRSLHSISVAMFPLFLVITSVGILNTVLKLVLGMRVVIFGCQHDNCQTGNQSNELQLKHKLLEQFYGTERIISLAGYLKHVGSPV